MKIHLMVPQQEHHNEGDAIAISSMKIAEVVINVVIIYNVALK
jgi:hypothetical protein